MLNLELRVTIVSCWRVQFSDIVDCCKDTSKLCGGSKNYHGKQVSRISNYNEGFSFPRIRSTKTSAALLQQQKIISAHS